MAGPLAAKIRAKYPGVYDDMDDAALERAVVAKYPQYADLVEEPKKEKSVGGFLGNVVESGGRFISDVAQPILHPIQTAQGLATAAAHPVQTAQALGGALKDRYGSLEAIGNTLYEDPVGVLADVSTVATGGALLPGRVGRIASVISKATNPAAAIAKPAAAATEFGAAGLVRPALNPPKRLRLQQRAPLEIERTALKGRILTSKGAGRKAQRAAAETTRKAEAATQAGVSVPRGDVAQFPKTLQNVEDLTPNVNELDQLARLEADTIATLPENISPSELLRRRRALDRKLDKAFRAEERGGPPTGITEAGQQELTGRLRTSLRDVVPDVRSSDDAARRFGMVEGALDEAANRQSRLTTLLAGGGGAGLLAMGNPVAGLSAGLVGTALQYPQLPLALGIPPVLATQLAATDPAIRAALLARLSAERE